MKIKQLTRIVEDIVFLILVAIVPTALLKALHIDKSILTIIDRRW